MGRAAGRCATFAIGGDASRGQRNEKLRQRHDRGAVVLARMTHHNRSSQQRAHTFSRNGWADAQPGQPGAAFTDPASLGFSARTDVRPAQRKPRTTNLGWWALCVIGLAGFVLLVNVMLA